MFVNDFLYIRKRRYFFWCVTSVQIQIQYIDLYN